MKKNTGMETEIETEKSFIKKAGVFFKRLKILFDRFLYSDYYIAFIAVMVFLSWVTNNLIAEFTVFLIIITYTLYTQKTMLPLVPMLIMMAFMLPNNFQLNGASSYWYFGIIGVLPVSGFFWFFIKNKIRLKKSRFLIPTLVFCAALLCSGLFTDYYFKSVNFMMIGVLGFLYLFFAVVLFSGIDKLEFRYLAKCFFAAGLVIATQLLTAYLRAPSIAAGLQSKTTTEIGWAMSNTAAAALSMCIPAAFYLAAKSKYNGVFLAAAVYFIVGVFFTKSRGGVLFMLLLLPFSVYHMFRQTPAGRRKRAAVTLLASLALIITLLLVFWEDIGEVVLYLLNRGLKDPARIELYKDAFKVFLKYPVFGGSWLSDAVGQPPFEIFYSVHSTVFQYLASGGIFLAAAAVWFFGKRYLTFYADYKPHHIFFLMSVLSHDLYGLIDNTATLPYCIIMAGFIFMALEKEIRPEVEREKRLAYKQEKFYF